MRWTKVISMWPVGIVGKLHWEGPICRDGHLVGFLTAWAKSRLFPIDMAGFALNVKLLFKHPRAHISQNSFRGHLESDFLGEQLMLTREDVEPKAEMCSKVSFKDLFKYMAS